MQCHARSQFASSIGLREIYIEQTHPSPSPVFDSVPSHLISSLSSFIIITKRASKSIHPPFCSIMYSAPPLLLLLLPISLVVSSPLSARQLFDDLDPLASSGGTELLPSQLQGPNEQPIFFSFEEEPPLLLSDDQNSQNSFSFFPSESSVGDLFAAAAATTSDFICAASKTRVCGSANVGDTTQDLSGGGAGSGTYTLRVSEKSMLFLFLFVLLTPIPCCETISERRASFISPGGGGGGFWKEGRINR